MTWGGAWNPRTCLSPAASCSSKGHMFRSSYQSLCIFCWLPPVVVAAKQAVAANPTDSPLMGYQMVPSPPLFFLQMIFSKRTLGAGKTVIVWVLCFFFFNTDYLFFAGTKLSFPGGVKEMGIGWFQKNGGITKSPFSSSMDKCCLFSRTIHEKVRLLSRLTEL